MFKITKAVDYYIRKQTGKKILDIKFLGIGGAFDIDEGQSSALLETKSGKKNLIDCGYTSYLYLKKNKITQEIGKVFITHTHSDHISGLSDLIYDRFFIYAKQTNIECTPEVAVRIKSYLDICGHPEEQYTISTEKYLYIEEDSISVTKIDTTKHHWPVNNFPNSGFIFHFKTGESHDDYVVLIYSGDINIPITNLMDPLDYPFVYEKPENVFIFHDMTSLSHIQNPHTNFELLEPIANEFKNLFTYHHGQDAVEIINKLNPKMALTSLIIQGSDFVIEENRDI